MGYGGHLGLSKDAIRPWKAADDAVFRSAGWGCFHDCFLDMEAAGQIPVFSCQLKSTQLYDTTAASLGRDWGDPVYTHRNLVEASVGVRATLELPIGDFHDLESFQAWKKAFPSQNVWDLAAYLEKASRPYLRYRWTDRNLVLWYHRLNRVDFLTQRIFKSPRVLRAKILALVRRVARVHIALSRWWAGAREAAYAPGGVGAKRARASWHSRVC